MAVFLAISFFQLYTALIAGAVPPLVTVMCLAVTGLERCLAYTALSVPPPVTAVVLAVIGIIQLFAAYRTYII